MKCDCDHPRNDDGLHNPDCSLIAAQDLVDRAVDRIAERHLAFERPTREDYVRVTVTANGHTYEPAVEYREGDSFHRIAYHLKSIAHHTAHEAMSAAFDSMSTNFEAVACREYAAKYLPDHMPDPMEQARRIGERIAKRWPDRAYFVEVWQEGREGFAQVFQPFGVPRNR